MTDSLATVAYIGATVLHPQPGGLANPETARRGNVFGMIGMAIAVLATVLGPRHRRRLRLDRRRPGRRRVGLFAAKKCR